MWCTIVDDVSRAVLIYLMRDKGEVANTLPTFVNMVKNQIRKDVKIVRSDNGLEFKSGSMLKGDSSSN